MECLVILARAIEHPAIAPHDLYRFLQVLRSDGEVVDVELGQAEVSNLDEAVSEADAPRPADSPEGRLVVRTRSGEGPPVPPEDQRRLLRVYADEGEVLAVHVRQTPVAELDKSVAEGHARRFPDPAVERLVVGARAEVNLSVAPEDQCGFPGRRMCNGEVVAIDIGDANVTDLHELVAERDSSWESTVAHRSNAPTTSSPPAIPPPPRSPPPQTSDNARRPPSDAPSHAH